MIDVYLEKIIEVLIVLPIFILFFILAAIDTIRWKRLLNTLEKMYSLNYYKEHQQIDLMKGFRSRLFKYTRTISTRGVLEGDYKNHKFHIFKTSFYTRRLFSRSNTFTVGSAEFGQTDFPHILLRNKKMRLHQDAEHADRKILLEEEYLKDFVLHCPENYEIEVLQIFTHDLLRSLQKIPSRFSIELGGNRIYIYLDRDIYKRKNLEDFGKIIDAMIKIIDQTDGLLFRLKDDFEVLDEYYKK